MKRKASIDIDEMLNEASEDSDAESEASDNNYATKKRIINNKDDKPISKYI